VSSWGVLQSQTPSLAAFGAERLTTVPALLATLREVGGPRVHPVAPTIVTGRLFIFMEPTRPKGHDVRERCYCALHNGVADNHRTGGEHCLGGFAIGSENPQPRALATVAASYDPRIVTSCSNWGFNEAHGNGHGDVLLPDSKLGERSRREIDWSAWLKGALNP